MIEMHYIILAAGS